MERHGHEAHHCDEYATLSRRGFLDRSKLALAAVATAPVWLPKIALARGGSGDPDVLVTVFLRGGMDGLTTCVPYGDPDLYTARPTLAVQPPGMPDGAVDLDGFFGLAPAAAPLLTPYSNGHLLIVHATGSTDPSRSHFDAMKFMETATPNMGVTNITSGWLARHLQTSAPVGNGTFRGLAHGNLMPTMLNGAPGVLPIADPASFAFPGSPLTAPLRRATISDMYASAEDPLGTAALGSLATIDLLDTIDFAGYTPANGAVYPDSVFAQSLRSTAALIKAQVGVEVAHLDLGGWDHHNQMGPIDGILAGLLDTLTKAIEAFYLDMQQAIGRVVLVVQSEFGRRVAENGSAGLDHGHGNCMLVLGGHIDGGRVLAQWPGLAPDQLGNGDLPITIDYRDILAEIVQIRLQNPNLGEVFPNYSPNFQGITV